MCRHFIAHGLVLLNFLRTRFPTTFTLGLYLYTHCLHHFLFLSLSLSLSCTHNIAMVYACAIVLNKLSIINNNNNNNVLSI